MKLVQNPIRTPLLFVSVFVLFGTAISSVRDGGAGPQGITPAPQIVAAGNSTTLEITLNQASSTNTVIALSSTSSYLTVPSTVTIPAGETVGYTTANSNASEPSESPVITAAANGLEAQCQVIVTAVGKGK